jgi:hypothetical protein
VGGPEAITHLDKLVHALVFGAVALTGLRAGLPVRPLAVALIAHAGVSELIQGQLLDQRGGDPWDAAADVIGTVLGGVIAGVLAAMGRAERQNPGVDESPTRGTLGA